MSKGSQSLQASQDIQLADVVTCLKTLPFLYQKSTAVKFCRANGGHQRLLLITSDYFRLPFFKSYLTVLTTARQPEIAATHPMLPPKSQTVALRSQGLAPIQGDEQHRENDDRLYEDKFPDQKPLPHPLKP
jgi:hypothetical protein